VTHGICCANKLCRQEFLEPGESVVLISMLKKINKLANKKVQLILTDKPQLICVDPAKMVAKGNIVWSDDPSELNVQVSNSSHFRICTVFVFLVIAYFILC
jgi:3-phosphoinositide dependent protein kinase-1